MTSPLRQLARIAGLDPVYTSFRGEPTVASDDALMQTLRALGHPIGAPEHAPALIAELEQRRWRVLVPPVVLAPGGRLVVPFAVPADNNAQWELEVTTESGQVHRARGRMFELPGDSHAWPDGVVHCLRRATLPVGELGYHDVAWSAGGIDGRALAIAAPAQAYGGPGHDRRRWGVFAPVYGLASAASGQAGDLASLRALMAAVERRGGRYVATLPLLAAFLDQPCAVSPYSPASRLYWNELYLDLAALCAEAGVAAPVAPAFEPRALIDYRAQYRWRRAVLDTCAPRLVAARGAEIDAWAREMGVYDYAAFRAIGEREKTGWAAWPAALRDGAAAVATRADALALGGDPARVDAHVVGQWAMQRQLEALGSDHRVESLGGRARLYLDLPVGVSCDAYEVWRWRDLFLLDLAAGAPPDALFLGGQDWGLPPLSPAALRRDRYRYFIACVRHHMKVSGMLRVDHVMGLFRLYCVPSGRPATDGVYVRYHADELLAILALESSRARCAVAGEDLGTVPDQVRPAMASHGLYRLHVGQWFLPHEVGARPAPAPAEAVASLNTHDTATFAGWWRGADIDDQLDLGLITPEQERMQRSERGRQQAALLALAPSSPQLGEVGRAMVAATADLAAGPAEVVLLALDDLALDPVPHNVPGTVSQRPNWQRRVDGWADALDEERAPPAAAAAIAAVTTAR